MRLWRKASGAIKDSNSIWLAGIARRSSYRDPELEAAVIRATSHDESSIDYKSVQRVFQRLRASPSTCLKPTVYALSRRVQKTRSWAVALKALILLHGVFCCKVADVRTIGRLPFDLSNFIDAHTKPAKTWAHSALVRHYFAFLDQRAVYLCTEPEQPKKRTRPAREEAREEESIGQELLKIQKWQHLLDLLVQIKPAEEQGMDGDLILEVMNCVIIEIFDVYSGICDGIASILVRIYGVRAFEASMALRVLKKATVQSERLSEFFEFCREIGVLHAKELPEVERIPEEDIQEVERIISELSERSRGRKSLVVVDEETGNHMENNNEGLRTVITEEWEVFDEDPKVGDEGRMMIEYHHPPSGGAAAVVGNYKDSQQRSVCYQDLPDLISF